MQITKLIIAALHWIIYKLLIKLLCRALSRWQRRKRVYYNSKFKWVGFLDFFFIYLFVFFFIYSVNISRRIECDFFLYEIKNSSDDVVVLTWIEIERKKFNKFVISFISIKFLSKNQSMKFRPKTMKFSKTHFSFRNFSNSFYSIFERVNQRWINFMAWYYLKCLFN